jgi:basic membrane protein A and related proteins
MNTRMRSRWGGLAFAATLVVAVVSGCTSSTPAPTEADAGSSDTGSTEEATGGLEGTIAIAYDLGGRSQPGFNQLAYIGVEPLLEANPGLELIEAQASLSDTDDVRAERLRLMAEAGANPIIAIGFLYAAPLTTVAAEFPDVKFGIVDDGTVVAPNVAGILFKEEEGSFLVGVAAALKSETGNVGFIGGVSIPLIQKFEAGYTAGAKAVNPDINVQVTYISNPPDFSGFNDPAKGKEAALGMFQNGADIVFAAGGATGAGVHQAAFETGNFSIGVDADEYTYESNDAWKTAILTSMLKRVDTGVRVFVEGVFNDTFTSGNQTFGFANEGVGYTTSGGLIDDITGEIDAYGAKIASGEVVVPDAP